MRHRKGRSVLTGVGIALGVAILFGVLVSSATTASGVDRLIADFIGRADVLVSPTGAFDAAVPSSEVSRLANLPGVDSAVGRFSFGSSIKTPKVSDAQGIQVRGIDLDRARQVADYPLAAGRFFTPGAHEVVIPQRLATTLGLRPAQHVNISTPGGFVTVTVTGILRDAGAGRTNQGDVAYTSIGTALKFAGRRDRAVTRIELVLAPAERTDRWISDHRDEVGAGYTVENTSTIGDDLKDVLAALHVAFGFFAAISLFVGAFLIYMTLSTGVVERVRMYGTLRALGVTRGQLRRLVMAEAVALGIFSTIVGLAFGLLAAKGLLALLSSLFEFDLPGLTVRSGALVAGVALGVLTTLFASLVPARRAAKLDPVVAMRGEYAEPQKRSRRWIAGLALLAAGVAMASSPKGGAQSLGTWLILGGAIMCVPAILRPLARVAGRVTERLAPGLGEMAVLHLVKERKRSAYTLGHVMIVMAMIFSIGGLSVSMGSAVDDILDRQFGADLHVDIAGGFATLDEHFEQELRSFPGIDRVTAVRFAQSHLSAPGHDQEETFVLVIDPATYFGVATFPWVHGSDAEVADAFARGGAVALGEAAAKRLGVGVGDEVTLETSSGPVRFNVAATSGAAPGPPVIVMGLADGRRWLAAGKASEFSANVRPGADVRAVKRAIERDLGSRYGIEVETAASLKQEAKSQFARFFAIFYGILLVAAVVAILGLANTLGIAVLQRSREIGMLRAVGTTRRQVRLMVLAEAATLSLVAFVLSVPLGFTMSALTVRSMRNAIGFTMPTLMPASWVPVVAIFGVIATVLGALAPARRAARLDVVKALQFE